jgi:hypothetical protein
VGWGFSFFCNRPGLTTNPSSSLWTEPQNLWTPLWKKPGTCGLSLRARLRCKRATRKWTLKRPQIANLVPANAQGTADAEVYVYEPAGSVASHTAANRPAGSYLDRMHVGPLPVAMATVADPEDVRGVHDAPPLAATSAASPVSACLAELKSRAYACKVIDGFECPTCLPMNGRLHPASIKIET